MPNIGIPVKVWEVLNKMRRPKKNKYETFNDVIVRLLQNTGVKKV